MAVLTVQEVVNTGLNPSYAGAAAGGDEFANNGDVLFHVKNGDASAHTVTINSQVNCNQGFDHDGGGSIPAGEERMYGPFPKSRFNPDGNVQVTYDAVTSVTVAAIKLPR